MLITPLSFSPSASAETASTELSISIQENVSVALGSVIDLKLAPSGTSAVFGSSTIPLTVVTNNPTGYSISVSALGGDNNLRNTTAGIPDEIDGRPTVVAPIAAATTKENFAPNTWGYYLGSTAATDSTVYQPLPTADAKIATSYNLTSGDYYNLTVGAAVDNSLPAGTYTNSIVVSVVTNPAVLTLNDLYYMQDADTDICASTPEHETTQLLDRRDGKLYWVAKLADGHCWMTQNLDLDLSTDIALTPQDSDVTENWTPVVSTSVTVFTQDEAIASNYSWDFGTKALKRPDLIMSDASAGCSWENFNTCANLIDVNSLSPTYISAPASETDYSWETVSESTYDAHYLIGNYYQWGAATAGSGANSAATENAATSSICPRNWRLPLSGVENNEADGSFGYLLSSYGIDPADQYNTANLVAIGRAPFYFNKAGFVYGGSFGNIGSKGELLSATAANVAEMRARSLFFGNDIGIVNANSVHKVAGSSIRCRI